MPRRLRRLYEHPDMFDPDWNGYCKERRDYLGACIEIHSPVEPRWLVEGLLPMGYLAVLAGKPKDGKTVLAATLAAAVSRGEPFAGMGTAQNRVLYLAAEESPAEWDIALTPWLGETDPKWFHLAHVRFALDHVPDLYALTGRVTGGGYRLVVVDPLLAATVGGSFTDSRRARHVLMGLKTMCAERDCACLVVHHAKERGGQALRVAENPQLAATASLNMVLSRRDHPEGRVVSLSMTGRGRFANRTLELLSREPCHYEPLPEASPASR